MPTTSCCMSRDVPELEMLQSCLDSTEAGRLTVFSKLMKRKQVVVCVPDRFVSKVMGSLGRLVKSSESSLWMLRFCLDQLRNIAMLSDVTGDCYSCTHFILVVIQCSLVLAKLVWNMCRTQSLPFKILVLAFWALHAHAAAYVWELTPSCSQRTLRSCDQSWLCSVRGC